MTTKVGHTNHTIGTGLVTAVETFTYQDDAPEAQPVVPLPSDQSCQQIPRTNSYEQQRLAMQQNRQIRLNNRLKRSNQKDPMVISHSMGMVYPDSSARSKSFNTITCVT